MSETLLNPFLNFYNILSVFVVSRLPQESDCSRTSLKDLKYTDVALNIKINKDYYNNRINVLLKG